MNGRFYLKIDCTTYQINLKKCFQTIFQLSAYYNFRIKLNIKQYLIIGILYVTKNGDILFSISCNLFNKILI